MNESFRVATLVSIGFVQVVQRSKHGPVVQHFQNLIHKSPRLLVKCSKFNRFLRQDTTVSPLFPTQDRVQLPTAADDGHANVAIASVLLLFQHFEKVVASGCFRTVLFPVVSATNRITLARMSVDTISAFWSTSPSLSSCSRSPREACEGGVLHRRPPWRPSLAPRFALLQDDLLQTKISLALLRSLAARGRRTEKRHVAVSDRRARDLQEMLNRTKIFHHSHRQLVSRTSVDPKRVRQAKVVVEYDEDVWHEEVTSGNARTRR